jgi:glycosyltransferase involved in cell wall biosynthesis
VRLQIIGEGPLRGALDAVAAHAGVAARVSFLGFRADRLELLAGSSILVLPSLTEGISRAAMEAMAMRKVVIGTDIPGIRELITDGESGRLVPTKSPREIAAAIDYVIDNPAAAGAMGREARAVIERGFSAERAAREYEVLYSRLMR